jgi:bifunctional non-homologous end joining protein LigD
LARGAIAKLLDSRFKKPAPRSRACPHLTCHACLAPPKPFPIAISGCTELNTTANRLIVVREDKRVRLFTKNGNDWTGRFPWIVEAALKNRRKQFVIDGEAVILGVDGVPDFNALHSGGHDAEVQLYAFDCLVLEGEDLRNLPLSMRKTRLARLLARRPDGIFVADFERGEIGPGLFRKACEFGLEGIVSKRSDRPYRAGRSKDWIKVKNRTHPAMSRVMD